MKGSMQWKRSIEWHDTVKNNLMQHSLLGKQRSACKTDLFSIEKPQKEFEAQSVLMQHCNPSGIPWNLLGALNQVLYYREEKKKKKIFLTINMQKENKKIRAKSRASTPLSNNNISVLISNIPDSPIPYLLFIIQILQKSTPNSHHNGTKSTEFFFTSQINQNVLKPII